MTTIIVSPVVLQKSAVDLNPLEVGDTLTVVLNTDDGSYDTKNLTLTYVGPTGTEYGYDYEVALIRPSDIKAFHSQHNPTCASS